MIIFTTSPPPIMHRSPRTPHPTCSLLHLCWHQPLHTHWHLSAHLAPTVIPGTLPAYSSPGSPSHHIVAHPGNTVLTSLVFTFLVSCLVLTVFFITDSSVDSFHHR